MPKNRKLDLSSGIQILTTDDEVCIPSLSSILLSVLIKYNNCLGVCSIFAKYLTNFDSPN